MNFISLADDADEQEADDNLEGDEKESFLQDTVNEIVDSLIGE